MDLPETKTSCLIRNDVLIRHFKTLRLEYMSYYLNVAIEVIYKRNDKQHVYVFTILIMVWF